MHPNNHKIALFIDGVDVHSISRKLNFDIDYRALLKAFKYRGLILRAFYYTAISNDYDVNSIRPLLDWLEFNGFAVVTKEAKGFSTNEQREIKNSMVSHIAVDMMELSGSVDEMFIFSGDGNLRAVVAAVQRKGVRVSVVSSLSTRSPVIADELRRQADEFIELRVLCALD